MTSSCPRVRNTGRAEVSMYGTLLLTSQPLHQKKPSLSGWRSKPQKLNVSASPIQSPCHRKPVLFVPFHPVHLKAWVFRGVSYCLPSLGSEGLPEACFWCLVGWRPLKASVGETAAFALERAATAASSSGGAAACCPSLQTAGCSLRLWSKVQERN